MTDEQLDLALASELFGLQDARIDEAYCEIAGLVGSAEHGTVVNSHGPRPTQSWRGMELVVEAMGQRGWILILESPAPQDGRAWSAMFRRFGSNASHRVDADTAPRAVAAAALMALREGAE